MLIDFSELPYSKQVFFTAIARDIKQLHPKCGDVFVYGSYAWGCWNENSDFDVAVFHVDNYTKTMSFLRSKYGTKIDIAWFKPEAKMREKLVKIPI